MVKKEQEEHKERKEHEKRGEPSHKNGFTVGELQNKMQKYGFEISMCSIFIITALFTVIWGGMWVIWSIILCMAGGVVGVLFPMQVRDISAKVLDFIYKERFTCIVVAILGIVIGIFLPSIIFALVGLAAGKSFAINSKWKG